MISRETITKVRDGADIAAVVGESVKLVRRGRQLVGLCPFHKEKTPSFHVNPEHARFYCFGCKEHGSVIDFVMKNEGLTFREAILQLAERVGIEVDEGADDYRGQGQQRQATQELYDVANLAAAFFETQLREHPSARVAREELARRELQPETPTDLVADALQAFRIGYAPAGWDSLSTHLLKHQASPVPAEKLGLLVPRKSRSGHYDFFRNRLVFPILDVQGRVVGFSGRVLPDPETGEVDRNTGKYINSPESLIYKKGQLLFGLFQARQAIRQTEQAVVVEGNFDVVSLHARGVRNVVAPLGTAFTQAQAQALKRFSPKAVLLFDGDTAGLTATKKSREPCQQAGLDARVAVLPSGSDPDDFVRSSGVDALQRVVAAARGMLEFLIGVELDAGFSRGDARDQADRIQRVAALLASENDPTVRALAKRFADTLASRLNITDANTLRSLEATVRRALSTGESVGSAGGSRGGQAPERARSLVHEERLPLEMIGSIIDFPEILDDPQVHHGIALLEGDFALAAGLARKLRAGDGGNSAESFLAHLPLSIHDFAAQRLAWPRHEDRATALEKFLHDAQKLKLRDLSREHAQVVEQVDRAGAQGDVDLESDLLLEAVRKHRERLGL